MFAKVAILFAVFAAVHAYSAHLVNTGISATSRKDDGHGNYAFGYDIKDKFGASNSRSEVGDGHGNKKGSYTLMDKDGRARKVEYVADKMGFRAVVKTNEPGTAHSAPAAALYDAPHGAIDHVAATKVVAAPAIAYGGHGYGLGDGYGYGAGLGYGAGYGLGHGYGAGIGLGNGYGAGLGLGHGLGYGYGGLGYGYGAGIGKGHMY